jgi:hypothetical protein
LAARESDEVEMTRAEFIEKLKLKRQKKLESK